MRTLAFAALFAAAAIACVYAFSPDVALASHFVRLTAPIMACVMLPASTMKTDLVAGTALRPVPRAVTSMGVRADVNDPKKMLAELHSAFEAFKAENDKALKAKVDDVVMTEKIGRIDAAVDGFQKIIDDLNAKIAAQAAGGGVIGDIPPDPEYLAAFKAHMRKGTVEAALTKGTDADGGYLAPVEWDRSITGKLKQVSPIRANARVISITAAGFKKLFTDRSIASGWVGETAARPETAGPGFGQLDFTPGEIYANPAISQQLLDDAAIDLEQWLADEVDTEFARQEGIAFLSGNGVNKPFGILTYVAGAANAAKHPWGAIPVVNSGAAALLTADGFIDLFYSLPSEYRANAKLYTARGSQAAMRKLKDGQNNYLWQPSYAAGQPATLGGETIVDIPDMPAVAAGAIAALYGDMGSSFLVVDRVGIRVLRDPYTNKPYVHFYTTKRVGGGLFNPEPMRALKVAANS
ncbi:phage major capsid protein [Kaistia defluvii]|uniref:phage major capsid protein n=1 Tax=Kaistia defluvii TaxID=410841 RepID=UPI00224D1520|nr:phage major capsid protein [Kaistia defluvii]MCX5518456.1 phage major capsid protein [Kaistia defluvii]